MVSRSRSDPAALAALVARIRACRVCVERPLGTPMAHAPRPVLQVATEAAAGAAILVASQAPGTKVHASGRPFTDASGDRLRAWMGVTPDAFYDAARIAIAPMGFCFPGQDAAGGDLPPRRECVLTWHDALFAALPPFALILAVGRPAQAYHLARLGLGAHLAPTLTQTVANWRQVRAAGLARDNPVAVYTLPHPSWRNTGWLKRNPFFEAELVPQLQADIARLLGR